MFKILHFPLLSKILVLQTMRKMFSIILSSQQKAAAAVHSVFHEQVYTRKLWRDFLQNKKTRNQIYAWHKKKTKISLTAATASIKQICLTQFNIC